MGNRDRKLLFTIIIRTYNRAHLLSRAIRSVLNQSYQHLELIIIDDASNDNTQDVVNLFQKDKRITYYRQEANMGKGYARYKGYELAKGDYVALLDDDDELLPEALDFAAEKIAELSPKGIKVFWFDDMDFVTKRVCGRIDGKIAKNDGYISYEQRLCDRVKRDFWVVADRNLINEAMLDESIKWSIHGSLYWLKFFKRTKVFHIAKVLYIVHREHGARYINTVEYIVKNIGEFLLVKEMFLNEHGEALKRFCPDVYKNELRILGYYQLFRDRKSEGRRTLLESLRFSVSAVTVIVFFLSYILTGKQLASLGIKFSNWRTRVKDVVQGKGE